MKHVVGKLAYFDIEQLLFSLQGNESSDYGMREYCMFIISTQGELLFLREWFKLILFVLHFRLMVDVDRNINHTIIYNGASVQKAFWDQQIFFVPWCIMGKGAFVGRHFLSWKVLYLYNLLKDEVGSTFGFSYDIDDYNDYHNSDDCQ